MPTCGGVRQLPTCGLGQQGGCGGADAACACAGFISKCSPNGFCTAAATGVIVMLLVVVVVVAGTAYYCKRVHLHNQQREALLAHEDPEGGIPYPPQGDGRNQQKHHRRRQGPSRLERERTRLCDLLGVSTSASLEEVRRAHRVLAREHHPDRAGDPAKFAEMQVAYETLSCEAAESEESRLPAADRDFYRSFWAASQ